MYMVEAMNVKKWIVVSGFSWLAIGAYLLVKGLKWMKLSRDEPASFATWIGEAVGSVEQGIMLLICVALLIGFVKGRFVLSRTVDRIVAHLSMQKPPIRFAQAYDKKYYFILAVMMGLGMGMRFLPIPLDIRGFVDVTIGSALMNGSMLYFRKALKDKLAN
jgi:hypothetical protein